MSVMEKRVSEQNKKKETTDHPQRHIANKIAPKVVPLGTLTSALNSLSLSLSPCPTYGMVFHYLEGRCVYLSICGCRVSNHEDHFKSAMECGHLILNLRIVGGLAV